MLIEIEQETIDQVKEAYDRLEGAKESEPIDFEEIEDLFEGALDDVMDIDVSYRDMAHACVEALKQHLAYKEKNGD